MSKLAIGLGVLVLGSGASLTGAYALGAFDPDYKLPTKTFTKEEDIRDEIKNEGCVKGLFPGVTYASTVNNAGTSDGSITASSDNKVEGCLVVNWDRWKGTSEGSTTKGKGRFRFLWAMKYDIKGFIVFAAGNTNTSNKMKFRGVAYIAEYKQNENKGIIEKKKESSAEQEITQMDFPKANSQLEGMSDDLVYWGFTTKEGDLQHVETIDASPDENNIDKSFKGYGSWEGTGGDKSEDWSSNLSAWGTKVLTDPLGKITATTTSSNSAGKWTKVKVVRTPFESNSKAK